MVKLGWWYLTMTWNESRKDQNINCMEESSGKQTDSGIWNKRPDDVHYIHCKTSERSVYWSDMTKKQGEMREEQSKY